MSRREIQRESVAEVRGGRLDALFEADRVTRLLEYYADEGDVQRALNAATRLATYQARW
jgi:hypothetical protein